MAALVGLLNRLHIAPKPLQNLSNPHRKDDFEKASESQLFEKTTLKIDGEECTHDCTSCSVQYPARFPVEESKHLYGHIKAFDRHLLVATGKTDWLHKIHTESGSVCEAIDQNISAVNHGRLMLSASNIPIPEAEDEKATRVLLLPSFLYVDHVTPSNASELIESVVNQTSTNMTPLPETSPLSAISLPGTSTLKLVNCPHDYLILLCSHKTRDARCGQSAPLIRKELERHLRPLGLLRDLHDERPGGVGIYFISHVGGHKFAANVLIYRRAGTAGAHHEASAPALTDQGVKGAETGDMPDEGHAKEGALDHQANRSPEEAHSPEAGQCIWLARVRPEDCENIVRYTILKGKVVKPETQLRGGFDRCKQLASW